MRLQLLLATCVVLLLAQAQAQSWGGNRRNGNRGNRRNNRNGGNRNNGNGGNSNNGQGNGNSNRNIQILDCVEDTRGRLRQSFLDRDMDAICERHNNWMHEKSTQLRPSGFSASVDTMESKIYQILHQPKPQYVRTKPRPRKEYRMLTEDERNKFHNAINILKNFNFGNTNIYDSIADIHQPHIAIGAHWGAAFLPWHKQYLLMMEKLLQAIEPNIMIPYWDSTLDSNLGDQAANSIMWSSDFLGNLDGDVTTGPFAGWKVPRATQGRFELWRGNGSIGRMINDTDVNYLLRIRNYRNLTWHVDPYYEMIHGMPHLWIGGPMGTITAAAFDPVFYMHHAFIDLIWDTQRDRVYRQGGQNRYKYPGLNDDEVYGVGKVQDPFAAVPHILDVAANSAHYPPRDMFPFPMKNKDSLTEDYKRIYYYTKRPRCRARRPDCGSPYLFCIRGENKCAPKLQPGANCLKWTNSDPCYNGRCDNGVCRGTSPDNRYLFQFLQFLFQLFQP